MLKRSGQNQQRPTGGHIGPITLAASNRAQSFNAGQKMSHGPHVRRLATSPLPSNTKTTTRSRGYNTHWPTSQRIGFLTSTIFGAPKFRSRGPNWQWPTRGRIVGINHGVVRVLNVVLAAHWWLGGNVRLGLIGGSVVHCDVFVLVCCAFCILRNVHLMVLEDLDTHLVKVQGGGYCFWRRHS